MITRGLAAFLASFTLLNLLGNLIVPGFDSNLWWIDLRLLPTAMADLILAATGVSLLVWAIRPNGPRWRRRLTLGTTALMAAVAFINAMVFYVLLSRHEIESAAILPTSLAICAAMVAIAWRVMRPGAPSLSRHGRLVALATFGFCLVAFPLAQSWCFGQTDYRRHGDVIVVFGARAYANGVPSGVLADRVRTACELYHQGLAPRLIFSGGPGDGAVSEPQAMRRMARSEGVPDDAIELDEGGVNTESTVRNTMRRLSEMNFNDDPSARPLRILAVSNAYHLPRVKLAYQRAGCDVFTVPARETFPLPHPRYLMCREVVALYSYYFRPLAGGGSRT